MAPKLDEVTTKAAATDGRVATIESRQKVELEELKVGFVKSLNAMNDTISELEGKIATAAGVHASVVSVTISVTETTKAASVLITATIAVPAATTAAAVRT